MISMRLMLSAVAVACLGGAALAQTSAPSQPAAAPAAAPATEPVPEGTGPACPMPLERPLPTLRPKPVAPMPPMPACDATRTCKKADIQRYNAGVERHNADVTRWNAESERYVAALNGWSRSVSAYTHCEIEQMNARIR
jgi:hypothetical protein